MYMKKDERDYQIFISYRREGAEFLARDIYRTLEGAGYKVFFDVESLRSGKFNEALISVISNCQDFLLILPPNGLDRCMHNEDDWLRIEISCALKSQINIIPILMRGFSWPSNLPLDISDIVNYNGLYSNIEYYDESIRKLKLLLSSEAVEKSEYLDNATEVTLSLPKERTKKKSKNFILMMIAIIACVICIAFFLIKPLFSNQMNSSNTENANSENTIEENPDSTEEINALTNDIEVAQEELSKILTAQKMQATMKNAAYSYIEELIDKYPEEDEDYIRTLVVAYNSEYLGVEDMMEIMGVTKTYDVATAIYSTWMFFEPKYTGESADEETKNQLYTAIIPDEEDEEILLTNDNLLNDSQLKRKNYLLAAEKVEKAMNGNNDKSLETEEIDTLLGEACIYAFESFSDYKSCIIPTSLMSYAYWINNTENIDSFFEQNTDKNFSEYYNDSILGIKTGTVKRASIALQLDQLLSQESSDTERIEELNTLIKEKQIELEKLK